MIATAVVLLGVTAQFVLLGLLPLLDSFAVAPAFLAGLAGGCMFMRRQRRCTRGRCCWALWQARVPVQLIPCHQSKLLQVNGASCQWGVRTWLMLLALRCQACQPRTVLGPWPVP